MDNRLFREKLLSLVLPITFQQLMVTVVSASDALMVGVIGQDMLSAVSVVFFAGTAFFPGMLMRIFTPDPALIGHGSEYLRIVSVTYLMCGVSQTYLCIMKNSDLAAKSMVIGSTAALLNIVLNAVLIYGLFGAPRMEAAGAAAATAVSRAVELVWVLAELRKKERIQIRIKYILHPDPDLRRDFWHYTFPVLGNELVWGGGFTMYSVIMGHLGTDAVAANSIANIVKNIIASLAMGIGNGGAIIVGNELGAGRLERARLYGGRLCRISILSGICSGIFLLFISPLVLAATDLSPEAAEYLKGMLVMCSYYMVGKYVNGTTIAGIFCAGGDSRFGFLCDTVTLWCFTVPAGFLAAFVLHLPVLAVYFIINLDEIVKLPAVYRRYKKYAWLKDLTVEPRQEQG